MWVTARSERMVGHSYNGCRQTGFWEITPLKSLVGAESGRQVRVPAVKRSG